MRLLFVCCSLFVALLPSVSVGSVMESSHYGISRDVIGSFGDRSSSANYILKDTGGEIGTGSGLSLSYGIGAGFWEAGMGTISLSAPSDVTMGSITGTGQSALATNSATWTVATNNSLGYSLSWQASTAAMTDSNSDTIGAYTPAVADTPETWSVGSSAAEWGAHLGSASTTVDTAEWGAADTYGGGKWLNIDNSTSRTIASRSTETSGAGDSEVVYFGAEVGSSVLQPTGTYTVNVTMTATTL